MSKQKTGALAKARKLAAEAKQSGKRRLDGRVSVGLRLTPEVVEQLGIASTLRRSDGHAGWTKQAIVDEALREFLPAEIERLVGDSEG